MLIDMHSHILPGADHGSDSAECSLAQVKKAKSIGIDVILATPHFYKHRDNVADFLERRAACADLLRRSLDENGIELDLRLAAEVTLEVDLLEEDRLPELCIEGTNYILLEMPVQPSWTDWVYNAVFELCTKYRVRPLIAHIDRYNDKQLKTLLEMDVLPQINAAAVCNVFTRRRALKWANEGTVKFLCSDVHDADAPQYDQFKKALEVLGEEKVETMMNNAAEVLGLREAPRVEYATDGGLMLF